jgi:hypothetical protein
MTGKKGWIVNVMITLDEKQDVNRLFLNEVFFVDRNQY